jgi:hypothetical protein
MKTSNMKTLPFSSLIGPGSPFACAAFRILPVIVLLGFALNAFAAPSGKVLEKVFLNIHGAAGNGIGDDNVNYSDPSIGDVYNFVDPRREYTENVTIGGVGYWSPTTAYQPSGKNFPLQNSDGVDISATRQFLFRSVTSFASTGSGASGDPLFSDASLEEGARSNDTPNDTSGDAWFFRFTGLDPDGLYDINHYKRGARPNRTADFTLKVGTTPGTSFYDDVNTVSSGNIVFALVTPDSSGVIEYTLGGLSDDRAASALTIALVTIPEPSSLLLMGTALAAGLALFGLFRRK